MSGVSKEVAELLNIDENEFTKTKANSYTDQIITFINEFRDSYYRFGDRFVEFQRGKLKDDPKLLTLKFSKEDYEAIGKALSEKIRDSDYARSGYMSGFFSGMLVFGIKVNSDNLFLFENCSIDYYRRVFDNLEKGVVLTREQILPFLTSIIKHHGSNTGLLKLSELFILSGYSPTIEDVKYCLLHGTNLWNKHRQWENLICNYILAPEKYNIEPDQELFDYCKSIPILPEDYKFKEVSKAEYNEFSLKMHMIYEIRQTSNGLTVPKFKKIKKKYKDVPIDDDVMKAILFKPIKADLIKHLITLGAEFTDEHIDSFLSEPKDSEKTELWNIYKTRKEKEIEELQSQISQLKKRKIEENNEV